MAISKFSERCEVCGREGSIMVLVDSQHRAVCSFDCSVRLNFIVSPEYSIPNLTNKGSHRMIFPVIFWQIVGLLALGCLAMLLLLVIRELFRL